MQPSFVEGILSDGKRISSADSRPFCGGERRIYRETASTTDSGQSTTLKSGSTTSESQSTTP